MVENLTSVQTRHREVQDDQLVVLTDLEHIQRHVAVVRLLDREAVLLQQRTHHDPGVFRIIHDQHARRTITLNVVAIHKVPTQDALDLDQRGLTRRDPLDADGVERPHATLHSHTMEGSPTFPLLHSLGEARSSDHDFIDRQATAIPREATLRAPDPRARWEAGRGGRQDAVPRGSGCRSPARRTCRTPV